MSDIYKEVEILTVTYRSNHIIDQSLSNISENFRITVVENSNDINFKNKIEVKKNNKCILSGENLGFGKAFNLGAKSIKSKYIFHFNPDALINDSIIYKMYELSKNINFGIISAQETNDSTKIELKNNNNFKEVESVKGFVMFINNEECKETNYFDENFFLYLEEIDLCKRLREKGKKILLAKNILVKHLGGKSHNPIYEEKMEIQRNWHYLWSLFYFQKKTLWNFSCLQKNFKKIYISFFKTYSFLSN